VGSRPTSISTRWKTTIRLNGKQTGHFHTNGHDLRRRAVQKSSNWTKIFHAVAGYVIWMGTTAPLPTSRPGDVVEIDITGIGTLRNKFVAEKR